MKIKDIKKPGFFVKPDDERRIFVYEVFKNSDEKWLEEEPEAIWLVDRWLYDQTDHDDRKHYGVDGCIFTNAHENSDTEIEVIEITDTKYIVRDHYMYEDKPTYKELASKYKQALQEIKDIAEPRFVNGLNEEADVYNKAMDRVQQIISEVEENE